MDTHTLGNTSYFIQGADPQLLLISGMHGDETESARLLESWVKHHSDSLPSFLYIPFVSPSAVARGTRVNKYGNDLNRCFFDGAEDPEVQDFFGIVSRYKARLCLDLHEDRDRTKSFYLYDSEQMDPQELSAYREHMALADIPLFSGIDDPEDDVLDCEIDQGYFSYASDWKNHAESDEGFASKWLIRHGIVRRSMTLENPQQAATDYKTKVIDTVLPFFISRLTGIM